MTIDDQLNRAKARVQQRQDQAIAQQQERSQIRFAQIGDRNTNGNYDLTFADGGVAKGQGIKLFDSQVRSGDTVQVRPRSDGAYLIDGPQKTAEKESNLSIGALMDRCDGYLNGQIFNCNKEEEKDVLSAWAIGTRAGAGGVTDVYLLNLKTGNTYFLVSIPGNIQPCTPNNPPPGPPPPEPPPTDGNEQTFIHVWVDPGTNFQPAFSGVHCSVTPPVPTRNDTVLSNTTVINLTHPSDGRSWFYRSASGLYSDYPVGDPLSNWGVNALAVFTNSATAPPLPVGVAMPVVSTGYIDYANGTFVTPVSVGGAGNWIYTSATCTPSPYDPNLNPGPNPNFNRQPPPTPPVPNTREMTLSLDTRGNPIAFIRHSPSCVRQGDWAYRRSFRLVGGQIRNYLGKLLDDWRYTIPSFACRNTFSTDLFTNLNHNQNNKLWFVESANRPASIVGNAAPVTIPVKQRIINPNCSTTDEDTVNVSARATDNSSSTYTIHAIAVRVKKKRKN